MTGAKKTSEGGFLFPQIYYRKQAQVLQSLEQGDIDHVEFSRWSFVDEFLAYIVKTGFFEFADQTYPNPREKNEVPIWFLISCQFVLRLMGGKKYHQLKHFLNSGSVLSRVGFNIGSPKIGFNEKNKNLRTTAVDQDTVRKFFKDSSKEEIRNWYNVNVQDWFKRKRIFDSQGIFVLDQTHLVVPKNPNYEGTSWMPVDENGHLYPNYGQLSPEQKKVLPHHPCYSLSCLLNLNLAKDHFHIASYEMGPGKEDELVQAKRMIPKFHEEFPGLIKELLMDRGYIDGDYVSKLKKDYKIDCLFPLKKNMLNYQDAISIAQEEKKWELLEKETDNTGRLVYQLETAEVRKMNLWETCEHPLNVYLGRETSWSQKDQKINSRIWILCSPKDYGQTKVAIRRYQYRMEIEERYRQFKLGWGLSEFPSTNANLMEAHIGFIMMTYSLLQLYLYRTDQKNQTHQFIETLKAEEREGPYSAILYKDDGYAIMNQFNFIAKAYGLDGEARSKMHKLMIKQGEEYIDI